MKIFSFISILCWLFVPMFLTAQEDDLDLGSQGDRIRAMRVTYITERMKMGSSQSEKFWTLHDAFEKEQKALREKYRKEKPLEGITNEEADQLIENHFNGEEAQLALKRQYFKKFRSVISARQILMYQKASKEFNRDMLRMLQNRRRRNN